MNLSPRMLAVLSFLREVAEDDIVRLTREQIAEGAEVGQTTARAALRDLESAGVISREPSAGRAACGYRLRSVNPSQPVAEPVAEPVAGSGKSDPSPSRAGAHRFPPPLSSRSPATATGRAPEENPSPDGLADDGSPDDDGSVVEIGQAVVAWACDEVARLGKPPLDRSLIVRIGRTAKSMSRDGVDPPDLKLAAETLVQTNMADLGAALRRAKTGSTALGPSRRATPAEEEMLASSAAASAGARRDRIVAGEQADDDPHRPEEMVEVAWYLAQAWGAVFTPARLRAWSYELEGLPITVILWTLRKLNRSGEYSRFAPPSGVVYRLAWDSYREHWLEPQERFRRTMEAGE